MWMSSEQDPLCTSPNEESGLLANNTTAIPNSHRFRQGVVGGGGLVCRGPPSTEVRRFAPSLSTPCTGSPRSWATSTRHEPEYGRQRRWVEAPDGLTRCHDGAPGCRAAFLSFFYMFFFCSFFFSFSSFLIFSLFVFNVLPFSPLFSPFLPFSYVFSPFSLFFSLFLSCFFLFLLVSSCFFLFLLVSFFFFSFFFFFFFLFFSSCFFLFLYFLHVFFIFIHFRYFSSCLFTLAFFFMFVHSCIFLHVSSCFLIFLHFSLIFLHFSSFFFISLHFSWFLFIFLFLVISVHFSSFLFISFHFFSFLHLLIFIFSLFISSFLYFLFSLFFFIFCFSLIFFIFLFFFRTTGQSAALFASRQFPLSVPLCSHPHGSWHCGRSKAREEAPKCPNFNMGRNIEKTRRPKMAKIQYGVKPDIFKICRSTEGDSTGGRAGDLQVIESSKTVCRETELVLGYEARCGARRKKNRKIKHHLVPIDMCSFANTVAVMFLIFWRVVRLDATIFMNVRNDRVRCRRSLCKNSEKPASTSVEDAD